VKFDEWSAVAQASKESFRLWGKHQWPSTVTIFDSWPEPYRALADELNFPVRDVADAVAAVEALMQRITPAT